MISDIIKQIKLKAGTHADVATTGQGCFMNVIAYLNGEAQITDESECVCPVVRPIAIWLNDYLKNDERQLLIPYIERAMGSKTDDKDEVNRRVKLVVEFADKCAKFAAQHADSAAKHALCAAQHAVALCAAQHAENAEYATRSADYASAATHAQRNAAAFAAYAAEAADNTINYAENAEYAANRKQLIDAAFEFLNEALPKDVNHAASVIERAKELVH